MAMARRLPTLALKKMTSEGGIALDKLVAYQACSSADDGRRTSEYHQHSARPQHGGIGSDEAYYSIYTCSFAGAVSLRGI
jgi:hypothetical protein